MNKLIVAEADCQMIRLLWVMLVKFFSIHLVKSRSVELCVRVRRYMPRLNGQHQSKDRSHYGNEYGNSCLQKDNIRYSRAWCINGVRVARFFQRVHHYSSSFSPSEFTHFLHYRYLLEHQCPLSILSFLLIRRGKRRSHFQLWNFSK